MPVTVPEFGNELPGSLSRKTFDLNPCFIIQFKWELIIPQASCVLKDYLDVPGSVRLSPGKPGPMPNSELFRSHWIPQSAYLQSSSKLKIKKNVSKKSFWALSGKEHPISILFSLLSQNRTEYISYMKRIPSYIGI